jgi:hypothetical protein
LARENSFFDIHCFANQNDITTLKEHETTISQIKDIWSFNRLSLMTIWTVTASSFGK